MTTTGPHSTGFIEQYWKLSPNSQETLTKERILDLQLEWAKDRLCDAERDGDKPAEEAWHGYINALEWVQEMLLPKQGNGVAS
jgi:hypothetical protein